MYSIELALLFFPFFFNVMVWCSKFCTHTLLSVDRFSGHFDKHDEWNEKKNTKKHTHAGRHRHKNSKHIYTTSVNYRFSHTIKSGPDDDDVDDRIIRLAFCYFVMCVRRRFRRRRWPVDFEASNLSSLFFLQLSKWLLASQMRHTMKFINFAHQSSFWISIMWLHHGSFYQKNYKFDGDDQSNMKISLWFSDFRWHCTQSGDALIWLPNVDACAYTNASFLVVMFASNSFIIEHRRAS